MVKKTYFEKNQLLKSVFLSKYAYKDETTPDELHLRMSKEFARVTPFNQETIFNWLEDFKYIIPQGSVMAILGTEILGSLSNCFVVGQPYNSYGGIFEKDQQLAQLMKRRGGVGLDISTLSPEGVLISNAAKTTTGAVSFMERYSNTTREVAQKGRRGALMISIDCRHPDVDQFIDIKQDLTKVTGANISVQFRDDFMEAVEKDEDYILRFPCSTEDLGDIIPSLVEQDEYNKLYSYRVKNGDIIYTKKVRAKEIWNKFSEAAHKMAEPGAMNLDTHWNFSPDTVYDMYKGVTTNPCFGGETELHVCDTGPIEIADLYYSYGPDHIHMIKNSDGIYVPGTISMTGEKMLYKVNSSKGLLIRATKDHIFRTTENKDVAVKNLVGHRIMPDYTIRTEVDQFVNLGFIQGDGNLTRLRSNKHKGLEINFSKKDSDVLEIFKADLSNKYEGRKIYTREYNAILRGLKFDTEVLPLREFPDTYVKWDREEKKSFLMGLYSANGCVISDKRVTLKSANYAVIEMVQNTLRDFGIDSYYTTNPEKEQEFSNGVYTCKESYDLNISQHTSILTFARDISFVQKYKRDALERAIKNTSYKVRSVTEDKIEPVFDFSLASDPHYGVVNGLIAHNCGEIFMSAYDACRLIILNLFSVVDNPFTPEAKINYKLLIEMAKNTQILGDAIVDLELERIDSILEKIKKDPEPDNVKAAERDLWIKIKKITSGGRRTGCGITGLGDMLAALGLKYDSDEALIVVEKVIKSIFYTQLDTSIELAKSHGPFEGWDASKEFIVLSTGKLQGKNDFYQMLADEFPFLAKKMYNYGRRNVSWSTVAPAGSTSILAETTSGIEPLFMPYYMRRKKVNPGDEGVRVDFTDQNGDTWQEYPILHPKFKDWILTMRTWDHAEFAKKAIAIDYSRWRDEFDDLDFSKEELDQLFKVSPWYNSTANDIDWKKRIELQGIVQKYTSHSISSTLNLPAETSVKTVSDIYLYAWKKKLKGVTVYRDGCRTGVLVQDTSKFIQRDAPKREKVLNADIYISKCMGEEYIIVVGLMENKPYEVFAQTTKWLLKERQYVGEITKQSKGKYKLNIKDVYCIDNFGESMTNEEETVTRLVSTSLRHGAEIRFIVEQLNKTKGNLKSFGKVLARTLKKYIPDGVEVSGAICEECKSKNIIYEQGCSRCQDCGSSKCG